MGTNYDRRVAAGKFDPLLLQRIKRLTDNNQHMEALMVGAKMLGLDHLGKKLSLVAQLNDLEGFMPRPLGQYRDTLYDVLMGQAKRQLDPEEYKQFYGSF